MNFIWIEKLKKRSPITRNFIMASLLFFIALPGYLLINAFRSTENAFNLGLSLDNKIPFLPWTISIYYWIYILIFLPIFTIRDFELFISVAKAYLFGIMISLFTFLVFPVTIQRPELINPKNFFEWWVWINYTIDKPTALFPSMHVSNAILSALAVFHWSKKIGYPALLFSIMICLSTLTVKQHFIVDVIAGFILAISAYWLFIIPYIRKVEHLDKKEILLQEGLSLLVPMIGFVLTGILYGFYISMTSN
jgi:membrane-associated phospholipid phosphatase